MDRKRKLKNQNLELHRVRKRWRANESMVQSNFFFGEPDQYTSDDSFNLNTSSAEEKEEEEEVVLSPHLRTDIEGEAVSVDPCEDTIDSDVDSCDDEGFQMSSPVKSGDSRSDDESYISSDDSSSFVEITPSVLSSNFKHGRPNEEFQGNTILYEGSRLSRFQSATLILTFIFEAKLSKVSKQLLLNLIELHCPSENKCINSTYHLYKLLDMPEFVTVHNFCSECQSYLGRRNENVVCRNCHPSIPSSGRDLSLSFYEFDIEVQLNDLLNRHQLITPEIDDQNDGTLYDIHSGSRYCNMMRTNRTSDISYTWAIDGLPVFHTSNFQVTPLYIKLNELPMHVRNNELICLGLWFGKGKVISKTFLTPLLEKLNHLKQDGFVWNGVRMYLHPILCCADAVQKADLQAIHQFNGAFGCGLCYAPGVRIRKHRGYVNVYPYKESVYEPRTKERTLAVNC